MKILVTGGAGFIGSFLVDELVKRGHAVRIYDSLEPQVHRGKKPSYLNREAEFIHGDICDKEKLHQALKSIDVVFHKAALLGIPRSMYEISRYTKTNSLGTAILLDLIVNKHKNHIKKMIVAASMASYGEGLYKCKKCGPIKPSLRAVQDLKKRRWEPRCPLCSSFVSALPTNETVSLDCSSIYAIHKREHEDMFLTIGKAFQIPAVALRYFSVYGPRQSLSNPYTGAAPIFISRIKSGKSPIVFEDGRQMRDFVSVHDVVAANILAMENPNANYQIFNIGSGKGIPIREVAFLILKFFGSKSKPHISHQFRTGDIRHCFADITKIRQVLNWNPRVSLSEGLQELIQWSYGQKSKDRSDQAVRELKVKGLVV